MRELRSKEDVGLRERERGRVQDIPSLSESSLIDPHLGGEPYTVRHTGDLDYLVTLLEHHSNRIRAHRIAL